MQVKVKRHGKAKVEPQAVSQSLQANLAWLKDYLGYKETFDLIVRDFKIGSRDAALVYLDSFVDQTVLTLIMEELFRTPDDALEFPSLQKISIAVCRLLKSHRKPSLTKRQTKF